MRDQENYPFLHQCSAANGKAAKQDAFPVLAGLPPAAPFHFSSRRIPIDWRLLHGIDVSHMIRRTDLDTLERVVGIVAFGDLDGEDTCNLTHLNFLRIFRLSQLTAEYLLHVQDHLAGENSHLKEEVTKGGQHIQAVRLRVREQKELLTGANKELRRLRKTLQTYELLAEQSKEQAAAAAAAAPTAAAAEIPTAPPQAPSEAPAGPSQQARAVVQVDPSTAWKLEKLELQAKDMKEEREGLLKDIAKLKAALSQLAACHQGAGKEELAAAVARTRREERLAADQRLTQAMHAQQQRLQQQHQQQLQQQSQQQSQQQAQAGSARRQDSHLSVSLSEGAEAQALQQKLAESLNRQRELSQQRDALELELVAMKKSNVAGSRQAPARRGSQVMFGADSSSPASATAAAADAKADRLARDLEEAEEQISAMTIKIRTQEKVIAELEQDSDGQIPGASDRMTQQVQDDLAQTEAELDAMTKDRDELQAAVDELEEKVAQLELEAQRRQLEEEEGDGPQASSEAVQRLQQQVGHLTQEVAALDDENRRLSEVIQTDQPHNEELLLHVKELQHEVTVTRAEADEARAAAAEAQTTRPTLRLGDTFRSFNPAERTSTVLEVEFHPEMSPRPGPLEQGALESPKKLEELDRQEEEEEALAQAEANYNMGPGEDLGPEEGQPEGYPDEQVPQDTLEQEYQEQAREARRVARADAAQAAQEGNHVQPLSGVAVRRLKAEMPHELQGHVRQGVMSRFPHSLQDYQSNIEEIQEELQGELTQQLEGYGIDPYAEGLTDEQYTSAMAELGRRRQLLMAGKTPEEQRRIQTMRNNMMWHLNNVGSRVLRSGKLPGGVEAEGSERAVEGMPRRPAPPPLTSKASGITVTSIARETEGDEEQAPRRLLLGRSQQPQGPSRRSLGDSSAPSRFNRVPGAAAQSPKTRPRRENSQLLSSQSYIHQDLLAPMSPGHESDEVAVTEAELTELEEGSARAVTLPRSGSRPVRRRLGGEIVPRLQPQKGAAALRDVREDFTEAKQFHGEVTAQGAVSQLQTRSTAVRTARSGLPQLRTGNSNVAFASTQSTLYTQSTLTRGVSSSPSSPLRGGPEGSRAGQTQPRAGQFDWAGQVDRAGPSGRLALGRGVRGGLPPPTPAPSPAGSPSIAAVYKPVQRSPEAQYRASRLRPLQNTKLRPLAQTPVASTAEEAAPAAEESLASDAPSPLESAPGQVEQAPAASQAADAIQSEAERVSQSTTSAVTLPGEGLKTTLSNPMFQPAADDVQPADDVSDVQELH